MASPVLFVDSSLSGLLELKEGRKASKIRMGKGGCFDGLEETH